MHIFWGEKGARGVHLEISYFSIYSKVVQMQMFRLFVENNSMVTVHNIIYIVNSRFCDMVTGNTDKKRCTLVTKMSFS